MQLYLRFTYARAMRLLLLAIALATVRSDLVLQAVAPVDVDSFPSAAYTAVLNTFASAPCSILSIQPDTITGSEAKQTYFPNITGVYSFQLIHVTRVSALVPTADASITANRLQLHLVSACAASGVGMIAIDTVSSPSQGSWLSDLPPSVIISLAIGWVATIILCAAGWIIFYLCCCKGQGKEEKEIPSAIVTPDEQQHPPPNGLIQKPSATAMPNEQQHPNGPIQQPPQKITMRLPDSLAGSAYRFDPYAAPESLAGPCAIRLASLCKHPTPTRP